MITITIDGKKIQTEEGTSVLEAALQNNIYIPHICHHPDLKDISACKLCYVQVEGQEKPVTSCMLKAEEGMNIITKNEEIQHLRNVAMELILAAHPEDWFFRNYPLLLLYPMYLNFASSNCLPHLPYIVRFIIFNLLLVPSTNPLL